MMIGYRVDDKYIMSMAEHAEEYNPLHIIFTGYMGAGKATTGRALSKELNIPFYDLDWYVESRMRKIARQILDGKGGKGFRMIEQLVLYEVAELENVIISCGSGTPCLFDNMKYMNRQAGTIYLKVETDVLYKYLLTGKSVRPLLLNRTADEVNLSIHEHLRHHEPFYAEAKHVLDVGLMDSHDEIRISANQLCQLLKLNKANSLKQSSY